MILQRLALRAALACALAAPLTFARPAHARQMTVILVCPSSVAPDHCNRDTATDVIIGPYAATPYGCLMSGLTTIPRYADGQTLVGAYAMTLCERRPD